MPEMDIKKSATIEKISLNCIGFFVFTHIERGPICYFVTWCRASVLAKNRLNRMIVCVIKSKK